MVRVRHSKSRTEIMWKMSYIDDRDSPKADSSGQSNPYRTVAVVPVFLIHSPEDSAGLIDHRPLFRQKKLHPCKRYVHIDFGISALYSCIVEVSLDLSEAYVKLCVFEMIRIYILDGRTECSSVTDSSSVLLVND